MILNKVLRTDLILPIAVVSMFFVRSQNWIDALLGLNFISSCTYF